MSAYDSLKSFLKDNGCAFLCDEPMSRHTTFKIGGAADLFITPSSEEQAAGVIRRCRELGIGYCLIGNGSNLLVEDGGLRKAVIAFTKPFGGIKREGEAVAAQAGALLSSVCRFACDNSLSGMEFAFGIPGSVGGAVYMNAGAYGGEMKDILSEVRALFPDGEIRTIPADEAGFGYRDSAFQHNGAVVLSARFALKPGGKPDIEARMDDIMRRRKDKQPLEWPSAGSVFKRPPGNFAGALIEQSGLKGFAVGGAQVSEKHAGFIINRGGASCGDVLALIEKVRETVLRQTGVMLEPEIKRLG